MKKKLLFLFMAAAGMLTATAQDGSLPMLEEGKTWNVLSLHPGSTDECVYKDIHGNPCCCYGEYQYVVNGDTVIEGNTYKIICREGQSTHEYLRQEGSHIYMYDYLGYGKDAIIYDFSLKERDTIAIGDDWSNRLVVDKVDSVKVDGTIRKRLTMNWIYELDGQESEVLADIWVEGIGGVVSAPCFPYLWKMTGSTSMVSSCTQDGMNLFAEADFFTMAWTASVWSLEGASNISEASYDLQGRMTKGTPGNGLYIRNGRKFIVNK